MAKYIRMSPKKIRLVADGLRGLLVERALDQLFFSPRRAVKPLIKVIKSAIANAEHNSHFKKENLYIKQLLVNEGPFLKRWTPKARGIATPIKRKSSHIVVVLEAKGIPGSVPKEKIKTEEKKPMVVFPKPIVQPVVGQKITEKELKKKIAETDLEIFDTRRAASGRGKQHLDKVRMKRKGGFLKRVFRRKAI